jgi:1,4-alpha-glucan branching enzyme
LKKGYIAIVLHAHLPYVHHPEQEEYLEERWLFEAISETYIPLISFFEKLLEENVSFRISISFTPPLLSMLSNTLLQNRYIKYLENLIELCKKEVLRTKNQPEFNKLAKMYLEKYKKDLYVFKDKYKKNLIVSFKELHKSGNFEFITSPATHGFLPLLAVNPESINAQIAMGIKSFEEFFGFKPSGMWLPECGYTPIIDPFLKKHSIKYFFTESHGILFANPRPVFGTFSPVITPNGLIAFGRDVDSSKQVWSAKEGYPGDHDYREFYRDIGYDLDYEYIKKYISPDGQRIDTGVKYYRITGNTDKKQPYNPIWATNKAVIHAKDFFYSRKRQFEYLSDKMDKSPIITCPYDAELFGHWWYEGPYWLYSLLDIISKEQSSIELITPYEYISKNPVMQLTSPCASSWGYGGYNEVWLNKTNDWMYRHLHKTAERMIELANKYPLSYGLKKDALNQAARELLLAQSSDWAFIIKTGTMVRYAEKRIKDHIGRFSKLYHDIKEDVLDESWLREIEKRDDIFPNIDYRIFSSTD